MNKKAGFTLGMGLLLVVFIVLLALFGLIDVFKENLNTVRGGTSLNCPDTVDFNSTDYADDTAREKLTRRPTCFVTGISMLWFISAVIVASITWLVVKWRKK